MRPFSLILPIPGNRGKRPKGTCDPSFVSWRRIDQERGARGSFVLGQEPNKRKLKWSEEDDGGSSGKARRANWTAEERQELASTNREAYHVTATNMASRAECCFE
uniref:Uncharacterized protein n=1 Tax=Setaria viridis TaxID=4556 RepID=A0A4U6TM96_SETVI|nr:hypothetical protein SEVIR_7G058700v2 [Setaria viridis]